jgi:mRNA interferase RelE/StbE
LELFGEYQIELIPLALRLLAEIKDQRELQSLLERIKKLQHDPEKQGKPLSGELMGYRSIRAVGQRYRIVYREDRVVVVVVGVGVGRRREGDKRDI